jgi:hypothetical protein
MDAMRLTDSKGVIVMIKRSIREVIWHTSKEALLGKLFTTFLKEEMHQGVTVKIYGEISFEADTFV